MFNQEIKKEFILDVCNDGQVTEEFANEVFSVAARYEQESDIDLNAMQRIRLIPAVSGILEKYSRNSWPDESGKRDKILELLRSYGRWSVKHRIENCSDELISLEDPAAVRYKTRFSANPSHLRQQLNDLFPLNDIYGTINDTMHCFFWMAYAGLDEAVAVQITPDHVDLRKMRFDINGKQYPIYTDGFPSIWNCVYLDQFMISHPKYSRVSMKDRAIGDEILRGFTEKNSTARISLDTRLTQAKFKTEIYTPNLTYRNVRYSGIFYRAFMQEMAGARVDFTEMAKLFVVRKRSPDKEIDKRNLWNKIREVKAGYNNWKMAFVPK